MFVFDKQRALCLRTLKASIFVDKLLFSIGQRSVRTDVGAPSRLKVKRASQIIN